IKLLACARNEVVEAFLFKLAYDRTTNHSAVAGDIDLISLVHSYQLSVAGFQFSRAASSRTLSITIDNLNITPAHARSCGLLASGKRRALTAQDRWPPFLSPEPSDRTYASSPARAWSCSGRLPSDPLRQGDSSVYRSPRAPFRF